MQVREDTRFDAAPDAVFAVLTDPGLARERAAASGALSSSVEVEESDGQVVVRTSRTVPTDQLPDAARRFVGETAVLEQEERWGPPAADGARTGALRLTVRGAPVALRADLSLRPVPGGTQHEVDGELRVDVPFLGRAVERAVAPVVTSLVRAEAEAAAERLRRR
ncbi:DUF2505 domain-containing protein [Kineococcus terrestris]|uniref:DUF2505 domain-containing protein n=1 Tax=Kineococcus terrestris TaxID=2044856 RepID=UPI0034DABDC9